MHFKHINGEWVKPIPNNSEVSSDLFPYDVLYVKNGKKIMGFNPDAVSLVVGGQNMPNPKLNSPSLKS